MAAIMMQRDEQQEQRWERLRSHGGDIQLSKARFIPTSRHENLTLLPDLM